MYAMTVEKFPFNALEDLINYAVTHLYLDPDDKIYVRNKLYDCFKIDGKMPDGYTPDHSAIAKMKSPTAILKPLLDFSIKSKLSSAEDINVFETRLLDLLCPPPSVINALFDEIAASKGISQACAMLYDFCFKSNYIRYDEVTNNICWSADTKKARLDITINISKPEKDNKDVAAALKKKASGYPACLICKENLGFAGRAGYTSRFTLRTIPLQLDGECWYFQYSPFKYYNEHCIVLSGSHTPMNVDTSTVRRLFDFIDLFPHYFLGSNAALPIVGGSILTHDHYQGGAYEMPMHKAKSKYTLYSSNYPSVRVSVLDWYNNCIRVESSDRTAVETLFEDVYSKFLNYSNPKLNIISHTGDVPHNAVNPIARFNADGEYSLDLIFRNNRTDEAHPHGIFHVSEDLFNIKKESIGLIEAMGMFILPGRLAKEAEGIKQFVTGKAKLNELSDPEHPMAKHMGMIAQLINDHGTEVSDSDAEQYIEKYINHACERILKCTALFKDDAKGEKAFLDFLAACSLSRAD